MLLLTAFTPDPQRRSHDDTLSIPQSLKYRPPGLSITCCLMPFLSHLPSHPPHRGLVPALPSPSAWVFSSKPFSFVPAQIKHLCRAEACVFDITAGDGIPLHLQTRFLPSLNSQA